MMSEKDKENFRGKIDKGEFTQEMYDKLLKRFELEKIDLEAEYTNIIKKESRLSRRQRDLVPDFLEVRDMLIEKKKHDEELAAKPKDEQDKEKTDKMIAEVLTENNKEKKS